MITNKEYQQARQTLGYSVKDWCDILQIGKSVHDRYNSGERDVPRYIAAHINTLLKYEKAPAVRLGL